MDGIVNPRTSRIHILGASGSGTTTLGRAMSGAFGLIHLDTDSYFWLPTDPPFIESRSPAERLRLLGADLDRSVGWVLSGSLCGWGDSLIPRFDLVVFLLLPHDVRMRRLKAREIERYGERVLPGGRLYESSGKFLDWASDYDTGGMDMRSLVRHETWIAALPCPVLRIEGDVDVEEKLERITAHFSAKDRAGEALP